MSFESPDSWWLILRSAVLVAAFLGFGWALLVSRRDTSQALSQLAQLQMQTLGEIQRINARLGELDEQVRQLALPSPVASHRLAPAAPPPPAPAPVLAPLPLASATTPVRGYEMAIRMARGGASIEEIVAGCGTTRAEARLLRRLHCASGEAA
jgi:hypothetical protein